MHEQHPIDRRVGERQGEIIRQRRQAGPQRGPFDHALRGRHEGEAAFRFFAEQAQIGGRVADAEDAQAARIGKARPYPPAHEAPRHVAEALRVEIAEIDHIKRHGAKLTQIAPRRRSKETKPPPLVFAASFDR
jgi:hypothetical protein